MGDTHLKNLSSKSLKKGDRRFQLLLLFLWTLEQCQGHSSQHTGTCHMLAPALCVKIFTSGMKHLGTMWSVTISALGYRIFMLPSAFKMQNCFRVTKKVFPVLTRNNTGSTVPGVPLYHHSPAQPEQMAQTLAKWANIHQPTWAQVNISPWSSAAQHTLSPNSPFLFLFPCRDVLATSGSVLS